MIAPNAGCPEPARPEPAANAQPARPPVLMPPPGLPAAGQRPGVPAPLQGSGPDFNTLLKAMGRRWPLAVGLGLLASVTAALAAWFLLSPRYTGFALLQVHRIPPWIFQWNTDTPDSQTEFSTYQRLQMANLRRRDVINHVLKKDSVKRLRMVQEQPEPLTWLEDVLKVQAKEGQEIVDVSVVSNDPDEPVILIQELVESYNKLVVEQEQADRKDRVRKLEKLSTEGRDKLEKLQRKLNDDRKHLMAGDRETQQQNQQLLLAKYGEAQKYLQQVEFDLRQAVRKLAEHKASVQSFDASRVPDLVLSNALQGDLQAKQIQEKLARIEDYLTTEGSKYRDPEHATLRKLRRDKADLEKKLKDRRSQLARDLVQEVERRAKQDYDGNLKQLEASVGVLKVDHGKWKEAVAQLEKEVRNLGATRNSQDLLVAEIQGQEKWVEKINDKLSGLQSEVQAGPRVTLWQPAGLQKVDLKRRILAAGFGGAGVLFLVCFGVGWWEYRAQRIQSAEEVTSGLGMRVVGAVPALAGPALARLVATVNTEDASEHSVVESMDAIRTMLLRDASLQATRVLMVTSAVAGEGKTTLAGNLAASLARAGRKTLLIDCDLRCPSAHQLFEQSLQPGFSEILLGEVDLIDAIRPTTAIDGLWLIPAGQWDREVVQALARPGVQEIFERLKEEFDYIVVDSHPVLPAADSLLLGQHVDAVIFSLMRDISQTPRVQTAGQRLADLGIRVLGAVVNGMPNEAFETNAPAAVHAGR